MGRTLVLVNLPRRVIQSRHDGYRVEKPTGQGDDRGVPQSFGCQREDKPRRFHDLNAIANQSYLV